MTRRMVQWPLHSTISSFLSFYILVFCFYFIIYLVFWEYVYEKDYYIMKLYIYHVSNISSYLCVWSVEWANNVQNWTSNGTFILDWLFDLTPPSPHHHITNDHSRPLYTVSYAYRMTYRKSKRQEYYLVSEFWNTKTWLYPFTFRYANISPQTDLFLYT